MTRGMKRHLIPHAFSDLARWPVPDLNVFALHAKEVFRSRKLAVEMYANGESFSEIKKHAGIGEDEVQRIVKRCLILKNGGNIYGFYACIKGLRIKPYRRKSVVSHEKGEGPGGCSGALTQIFERFPELELLVQELYFGKRSRTLIPETRMPIVSIHNRFKLALRSHGVTDNQWPFNTENCGYNAICSYCTELRLANAQPAALGRSGFLASQRGAVGSGLSPLIPCLRPFSFVQLDFHKVDAATIIILRNEFGVELEVPLSRWHIGLAIEEFSGAVIGAYVVLERTPSGDSVLEVVESALRPEDYETDDPRVQLVIQGQALLNRLIPELAYQCFSVLKVDNGTSNIAHEVVNNIIDTVGCAVNYGQVGGWWRRQLIESIFGELTAKGLQRLPSSHGVGPGDCRVNDPNSQAIKFRILLSEVINVIYACIKLHNTKLTEKLQWSSPVQCIQAALSNPKSGLFIQPLPSDMQENMRLMQHIEEVTVRGSIEKNERPYFNLDRWRYTNQALANSFWLIGKKLLTYTDRRECRIVYATVIETGEQLGLMVPGGWRARSQCSWRDRKMFNKAGFADRYSNDFHDPVEDWKEGKVKALQARPKSQKKKSSSDALNLARVSKTESAINKFTEHVDALSPNIMEQQKNRQDPFGLMDIPDMVPVTRGN
tara:strand:- start:49013 stop:50992 length:1980 start_codon:yes stop_codon:yes gene_type:complete